MLRLAGLLLCLMAGVAPLMASSCDTKGATVEKSFLQSVHDCVEYLQIPKERLMHYLSSEFPPDDETKCLLYCVGVDLRWWNNTCGLQVPAIVSYFQPLPGDTDYELRTNECLARRVGAIRSPNNCCQAYETFQCYFQEFGNLVTCPQYVPLTKVQATQAALDCLVVLRYPEDLLTHYAAGRVKDCPETRCLYHCIDLRMGLYTPDSGVLLSRFYVRDAPYNDLRYLSRETKLCRDRVRQSGCDKCSEVYTTHQECLAGLGEDGYMRDIITQAAKMALTNMGISCEHPRLLPVPDRKDCPREVEYETPHYPSKPVACTACTEEHPAEPTTKCPKCVEATTPKPPKPTPAYSKCHKHRVYNKTPNRRYGSQPQFRGWPKPGR